MTDADELNGEYRKSKRHKNLFEKEYKKTWLKVQKIRPHVQRIKYILRVVPNEKKKVKYSKRKYLPIIRLLSNRFWVNQFEIIGNHVSRHTKDESDIL